MPTAPRSRHVIAHTQPIVGHTDIDKIGSRFNSNIEGMVNAIMEMMMTMMTE